MIMRTRNHPGILLIAAFLVLAIPGGARADNLFRLFPEFQANGFYGDNIGMRSSNEIGDFGTTMVCGIFPRLHLGGSIRVSALRYFRAAIPTSHPVRSGRGGTVCQCG